MANENKNQDLETYLQDHYAAAVGALDLIQHLRKRHADDEWADFFRRLYEDVEADQEQLHNLMTALGFEDSSLRNAGAWMAEKVARLKLTLVDGEENLLSLVQALETLYAGVTGKRLLWRALHAARDSSTVLRVTDFAQLEQRAIAQAERLDATRLSIARRVLVPAP